MKYLKAGMAAILALTFCYGCMGDPPEYALVINPSGSNSRQFESKDLEDTVRQVLSLAKFTRLLVVVAAEEPLELPYANCSQLHAETIMEDLRQGRLEQSTPAPNLDSSDEEAKKQNESALDWGWGTDHANALRRINHWRTSDTPLVVVMLTDGANEPSHVRNYPFSEVEAELGNCFSKGRTRMFLLGISQAIDSASAQHRTVMDQWRNAFEKAGAFDLSKNARATKGYFMSSGTDLPVELAGSGFAKEAKE